MQNKKSSQLFLDMDPGVDDALALLLAFGSGGIYRTKKLLKPKINLNAISCVCGNVPVNIVYNNASFLLQKFSVQEIPLFCGAEKPLKEKLITAEYVHGKYGLGNFKSPAIAKNILQKNNLFKNLKIYKETSNKIFCATGPLTNLAKIILTDRHFFNSFKQVYVMGGVIFSAGNITPVAEFNFYVDPQAADIVIQNIKNLKIIPLNITHQVAFTENDLNKFKGRKFYNFLKKLLTPAFNFHKKRVGFSGIFLHDPLAVVEAIENNFVKFEEIFIRIETKGNFTKGMVVVDKRKNTDENFCKCLVGMAVKVEKFREYFLERIDSIIT